MTTTVAKVLDPPPITDGNSRVTALNQPSTLEPLIVFRTIFDPKPGAENAELLYVHKDR